MQRGCLSRSLNMQDRFTGDAGDFGKYGLLRALIHPPLRLGIIWYRTPDGFSGGGRREYLANPDVFRPCDPGLFDALTRFNGGNHHIERLTSYPILPPDTLCVQDYVPLFPARDRWFEDAAETTSSCDLVFLDPDNGLAPRSIPRTRTASRHYVYPEEIGMLRSREKSLLIYHHLSRRVPVEAQREYWCSRLGKDSVALRFNRWGSRVFFLLPAAGHRDLLIERARRFLAGPWGRHFTGYGLDRDCQPTS